jgi:hypothetical protein
MASLLTPMWKKYGSLLLCAFLESSSKAFGSLWIFGKEIRRIRKEGIFTVPDLFE